jgi:AcrR family transcriptional regulator
VLHTARRTPGRPPAAKASDTRQRIVRAAREVFSELGYDAATFQAIANRADLTRPAINHYFSGKRVLYREVLEQTSVLAVAAGVARARVETTLRGQLCAFIAAAIGADSEDRSTAAFLVTSVLEAQRHPDLAGGEHDVLRDSRAFIAWAVRDAIEREELAADTDVPSLVEMLLAVLWGMGFYAGFVGSRRELAVVSDELELLLANKLWQLSD